MYIKKILLLTLLIASGFLFLTGLTGCDEDCSSSFSFSSNNVEISSGESENPEEPPPEGPPHAPAPGALLLGTIGVSFVAWLRRQRKI